MKICLLGEGAVGKTSLRQRFLGKGFETSYLITLGADFATQTIEIDQETLRYQIWDLAGQATFSSLRSLYYKGSVGALLVFDVTRPETLLALDNWIDGLYRHSNKVPLVLLGNKTDLKDNCDNPVEPDEAREYARKQEEKRGIENKITYLDTSALTGLNVHEAFTTLGERIIADGELETKSSYKWARARELRRK